MKKQHQQSVLKKRQVQPELEVSSTPMIIDLDPVRCVDDELVKESEPREKRALEEQRSETPMQSKSVVRASRPAETSQHMSDPSESKGDGLHQETLDNSGTRGQGVEQTTNRSQRRQEDQADEEKRRFNDKPQRTRSVSPDHRKYSGRSHDVNTSYLATSSSSYPYRWSEGPREYREPQDRYDRFRFQQSRDDFESRQSSSIRSFPQYRPAYRGRACGRFDTRQPLDRGRRECLLPPPNTYFGRQQPPVDSGWSRLGAYGDPADCFRSRSPSDRRERLQEERPSGRHETETFISTEEMKEFAHLKNMEQSRRRDRRDSPDADDDY